MKKFTKLLIIVAMAGMLDAQETVKVTEVNMSVLGNNLLSVKVEIRNVSDKPISEVDGYIDIYDKSDRVVEKKNLQIVQVYDIPMRSDETRKRGAIITQLPDMSGTARFRITHLRFFGEEEIYMICPYCGELILKE